MDDGEDFITALRRELAEELGPDVAKLADMAPIGCGALLILCVAFVLPKD